MLTWEFKIFFFNIWEFNIEKQNMKIAKYQMKGFCRFSVFGRFYFILLFFMSRTCTSHKEAKKAYANNHIISKNKRQKNLDRA